MINLEYIILLLDKKLRNYKKNIALLKQTILIEGVLYKFK